MNMSEVLGIRAWRGLIAPAVEAVTAIVWEKNQDETNSNQPAADGYQLSRRAVSSLSR